MKIKNIEAIPLVRQLEDVFHGSTYRIVSRNTVVTRVELDNGVVGETFGGDEDQYQPDVVRIVNEIYRPLLLGGDVRDVERHWERMWDTRVDLGNRGIHSLDVAKHCVRMQALAAVDIALWDALGKSLGQPVSKLLGGFREVIPVIAIGGYITKNNSTVDLETEVGHYLENQIHGMKLKVGKLNVEEDIERAHSVRRLAGPRFHLCVDANQSWTVPQAVKFAKGVRELDLAWIEEPVQWHDQIEGCARVREVGIPVNAGQGEASRCGCRDLVLRHAVDVLNVDATIAGGVTEWRRIAAFAHCLNISMAHHEEPQVALSLLSGISHGICVEVFPSYARDPMWFDLPVDVPKITNGMMRVPTEPGFGIPLRADTIETWRGDRG